MENLGANLLRYNIDKEHFLVPDCETEALNLRFSRPWSVGYLICDGKNIISKNNRYLWYSDLKVSKDAARITNFNYQEYKEKAEDPKKVYEEFGDYLYNSQYIKVGHNFLGIEVPMFDSWRRAIGLKTDYSFINDRILDTHSIAKAIKKSIKPTNPLIAWMYKLNSLVEKGLKTNLGLLAKENDIPVNESLQHDALYDVLLTWEIFKKQIWQIELEVPAPE